MLLLIGSEKSSSIFKKDGFRNIEPLFGLYVDAFRVSCEAYRCSAGLSAGGCRERWGGPYRGDELKGFGAVSSSQLVNLEATAVPLRRGGGGKAVGGA